MLIGVWGGEGGWREGRGGRGEGEDWGKSPGGIKGGKRPRGDCAGQGNDHGKRPMARRSSGFSNYSSLRASLCHSQSRSTCFV
jgi:hypothetical protein